MALYARSYQPKWYFPDLTGLALDDTYYAFFLTNDLPYTPLPVYETENGTEWANPVQFQPNGMLPDNLYFDSRYVYRIEIRQGNTQSDPLIYLIQNYVPIGESGEGPITAVSFPTENLITNPQFFLTSFTDFDALVATTDPDPIEVAPGWFLELFGTGNYSLEQVELPFTSSADVTPSNASYALRIQLAEQSWSAEPFLRQRFYSNGNNWANKYVSCSFDAKIDGAPQEVRLVIINSEGTVLANVITSDVQDIWTTLADVSFLPPQSNTESPEIAWIDYRLYLPGSCDLYLTSFQHVVSDEPIEYSYEQQSIERQVDHTFHYYKDSIILQPKESILTGWDFGLNPWQYAASSGGALAGNGYFADQTIIIQQDFVENNVGNNIGEQRATFANNYGLLLDALTVNNQFGILQYIDPATCMPYWNNKMSSLVKVFANTVTPITVKMRLFSLATLPSATARLYPVSAWTLGSDPTFAAGITGIAPLNDVSYTLQPGDNVISFESFQLPAATADDMVLGIMFYSMNNVSINDTIIINSISLVRNDFAIQTDSLSFDETLARCQFYWEQSTNPGVIINTATAVGMPVFAQNSGTTSFPGFLASLVPFSAGVSYKRTKRAVPSTLNVWSANGTAGSVTWTIAKSDGTSGIAGTVAIATRWGLTNSGKTGFQLAALTANSAATAALGGELSYVNAIEFHWYADSRMGI